MDEIDRVLDNEPVVQPSADFAAQVMAAVRREAATPPPLEFPWSRFLPGFFTAVALALTVFVLGGIAAESGVDLAPDLDALAQSPTARGVGLGVLVLLLSLGAAAMALVSTTRSRTLGSF